MTEINERTRKLLLKHAGHQVTVYRDNKLAGSGTLSVQVTLGQAPSSISIDHGDKASYHVLDNYVSVFVFERQGVNNQVIIKLTSKAKGRNNWLDHLESIEGKWASVYVDGEYRGGGYLKMQYAGGAVGFWIATRDNTDYYHFSRYAEPQIDRQNRRIRLATKPEKKLYDPKVAFLADPPSGDRAKAMTREVAAAEAIKQEMADLRTIYETIATALERDVCAALNARLGEFDKIIDDSTKTIQAQLDAL